MRMWILGVLLLVVGALFMWIGGRILNDKWQARVKTESNPSAASRPATQSAISSGANSPITQIGENSNVTLNQQGGVTILGNTESVAPPPIPEIKIETLQNGIKFDTSRNEISAHTTSTRRLHTLTIRNPSKTAISQVEIVTQFPEPIIQIESDASPAMGFAAKEHWDNPLISVKGDMPPAKFIDGMTTGVWRIQVGRIPGNTTLTVEILSDIDSRGKAYYNSVGKRSPSDKPIIWVMNGRFQFQKMGVDESRFFLTEMGYDLSNREVSVVQSIEGGANSIPWLEVVCMPGADLGAMQIAGSILIKLHGTQLPRNMRPFSSVERLDTGGQSSAIGGK